MKNNSKLVQEWLVKGQNDLESAKILYRENGPPDSLCFHCHQAIEKYLKGFLVYNQREFPKTHDLIFLVNLCAKMDKDFAKMRKELKSINKYYIEFRYPPEIKAYSRDECKDALGITERLTQFIANKIL